MNLRKKIDYSDMHTAIDAAMSTEMPQMELYCTLGRLVSNRPEKGAAVAAAEYLAGRHPDATGFSPRNLRRMRDFYRMYEENPELLELAMEIGWTQNLVILEAELSMEERHWYLQAVKQFEWTKAELLRSIVDEAHLELTLDESEVLCYTENEQNEMERTEHDQDTLPLSWEYPMAEFVMKEMVKKAGLEREFRIESAATSTEEIGNPVYPPARRKLAEHGIDCSGKTARQLRNNDYEEFDLLIGMDRANLRSMYRICGGDFADKMHLLMDFTDRPGEVADPWYTDDFDATWRDVEEGCQGLLHEFLSANS